MFYRPLAGFLTPKIVSPPLFYLSGRWCVSTSCLSRLQSAGQVFSRLCVSFSGPDSCFIFSSSQATDKKEREPSLRPLTSDPSSWFCLSSSTSRPSVGGKSVCSGQGGCGLSRHQWASAGLVPRWDRFPPPIFSFSLSHSLARSFARSFSPGPDSNQRLLEERADIYCRRAEQQQQHKFEALRFSWNQNPVFDHVFLIISATPGL